MIPKPIREWRNPLLRISAAITLAPLAGLLWLISHTRRFVFKMFFPPTGCGVPVVGLGSVDVGGTGKTPCTASLAETLTRRGLRVAVVSNGYGRKSSEPVLVSDGSVRLADVEQGGDEACMLADIFLDAGLSIPIVSDQNRLRAARTLVATFEPDVILLDDSLQYLKLKKDFEFGVIDADGLEERWLLPIGRLTEPLSVLKCTDRVLITKCTPGGRGGTELPYSLSAKVFTCGTYEPVRLRAIVSRQAFDLEYITGSTLVAFSGLGKNESFHRTVTDLAAKHEANLTVCLRYRDHYRYDAVDLAHIVSYALKLEGERTIFITTHKDAVKMDPAWLTDYEASHGACFFYLESITIWEQDITEVVEKLLAKSSITKEPHV